MICENCTHNDVCYLQEVTNDIEEKLKEFGCGDYKYKEDFVEVVRCKDCKYRGELDCPMYHEELQDCDDGDYVYTDVVAIDNTVDDGFCHCGEREGGEGDG